jgi:hypothetical protein
MHALGAGEQPPFTYALLVGSDEREGRDAAVAHARLLALLKRLGASYQIDW